MSRMRQLLGQPRDREGSGNSAPVDLGVWSSADRDSGRLGRIRRISRSTLVSLQANAMGDEGSGREKPSPGDSRVGGAASQASRRITLSILGGHDGGCSAGGKPNGVKLAQYRRRIQIPMGRVRSRKAAAGS